MKNRAEQKHRAQKSGIAGRPFLRIVFCAVFCAFAALPAWATEVGVVGLFSGKAVLVIDGGAPRTVRVGDTVSGVRLISVDQNTATVDIAGKREKLALGQQAYSGGGNEGEGQRVSLTADVRGHFITTGTINGAAVNFMVDTGATPVAIGMSDARRANINLDNAQPVMVQTANGATRAWRVKFASVRVGGVTLNEVDGAVLQQEMPVALLGMSFLNRMDMKRDGQTMTLRKRY